MSFDTCNKAKVIILCGQSNASGVSRKSYLEKTVGKERAEKLIGGFDNIKIAYHCGGIAPGDDPYHPRPARETANIRESFGAMTADCGSHKNKEFFGPELGMAEYLSEKFPGETFYIVKHSYGGSTIGDYLPDNPVQDFVPDVPNAKDIIALNSYGELKELFDKCVAQIKEETGADAELVAVCWMQGESEGGCQGYLSKTYKARQETLISNFRRDYVKYAPKAGIAFIDAEINGNGIWADHEIINGAKREIAASNPMNFIIDTNAAGLTCANEPEGNPDVYHYDSSSGLLLGNLFGKNIADVIKAW